MADPEADRLAFVLSGQCHADHYLTPLADPAGKSVLVVGSGAGTDVLWCLRQGAEEVVGIDILEQGRRALDEAAARYGVDSSRARLLRLPLEEAASLGRRFGLVLSNNVFEHVGDLAAAFRVCAEVVEPGSGRVAIFSSPLYLSSAGSHLPHAPWAHLDGDPDALRRSLLAGGDLPSWHALRKLDLRTYVDREISLNRARLVDFVTAIAASGLVALQLSILPDPRLAELGDRLQALRDREGTPSAFDLAVAGIALELALPGAGADAVESRPTSELRLAAEREVHMLEVERRQRVERETERWRAEAAELGELLARVEASWSFRLGRGLTVPVRWLREVVERLSGRC